MHALSAMGWFAFDKLPELLTEATRQTASARRCRNASKCTATQHYPLFLYVGDRWVSSGVVGVEDCLQDCGATGASSVRFGIISTRWAIAAVTAAGTSKSFAAVSQARYAARKTATPI